MFFREGWRPIPDFYSISINRAFSHLFKQTVPPCWYESVEEWNIFCASEENVSQKIGCRQLWSFLTDNVHYGTAGVLTSQGNIVSLSGEVFDYYDDFSTSGDYIDLEIGRLGTGSGPSFLSDGELVQHDDWRIILNPFLDLPVLLPEQLFKNFVALLDNDDGDSEFDVQNQPDEVVRMIIAAYDEGALRSRRWAKDSFAPEMKDIQWRTIWATAAAQRPNLSKPGPKSSR